MGSLYSVSSTTGDIITAGSISSTSTTQGFVPPKLTTTQRDATFTQASLVSQGVTYTSILAGTVGNSYSVTVMDSGIGGLSYTEPAGAIVIDLGGSTSTIDDVVLLIGTTTPSAFVTVSGSGVTDVLVHALESLTGGIQPVTGSQIYNTTTNKDEFFNGTVWGSVSSGGGVALAVIENTTGIININFPAVSGAFGDDIHIDLTVGTWMITVLVQASIGTASSVDTILVGAGITTGNDFNDRITSVNQAVNFGPTTPSDSCASVSNFVTVLASPTTYYLKILGVFAGGTPVYAGRITAIQIA